MRTTSPLLATLALSLLLPACDRGEPGPVPGPKSAKADAKPPAKSDAKPDAKPDAKASAKADAKADAKAEADGREPRGKADDPAAEKAIAAFAASRDATPVVVDAKPGTPEWFVQGLEAFRAGNIDPIVANFAPDITWDAVGSPLEKPSVGKAAVMARWEDLLIAIPDMKLHARRIFHHGDLVVMQVVLTGTHLGNFRGIAATEKPVGTEVLAFIWHDAATGKAQRVRVVYDEATILAQMGKMAGKLEGMPTPPIPDVPTGAPELIGGDEDAAAVKLLTALNGAGKKRWKQCSTKLCTAGFVQHDARTATDLGTPEAHAASHDAFFTAFPNMSRTVEDVTSFGPGWAVVFSRAKGTQKGPLGPLVATKKAVDLGVAELVRIEDGKVAESWRYDNGLELLAALGVFTAPTVPAAEPAEAEPAKAEPAKAEPAKAEPAKPE